ncbi:hypothetical protein LQ327_12870 [Actinomycetospora endophytica]|uniref:PH (Pleckstrin Homology) domain-containing protein n=1 Tax=Actinomycetospora endophytica TaxID=2291215 RepID=A0ABS8P7M6_9PSEU|nr:hypothetical protein [Actinomycetospora endophytica]MCD2194267.1 hypothetical protein [Actinomycetospora endophytica]
MSAGKGSPESAEDGWARTIREAHDGYHAGTRGHRDPDVLVDDVVTWRMLSPHLIRALLFLVSPTVLLLIWLLLDYLASTSSPSITGRLIMNVIAAVTAVLYLAGLASFFAPAKEPIAEYSRLLEGRAAAARGAYQWVSRAAQARRTPAEVTPSTVAGVPVLLFRQRSERAMLLVQPYGADLYVGWTMWRSRSTATLLAHFLRDTFGRFAPLPVFSSELRAASTRAMRESVHSLAREGVAAAAHVEEVREQQTAFDDGYGRSGHDDRAYDDGYGRSRSGRAGYDDGRDHAGRTARTGWDDERQYEGAPPPEPDDAAETGRPDPGALPRSTPAADPTAGWTTEEREREHATRRSTEGWGPPPRD